MNDGMSVATALQNIELINLKIEENRRLAMIVGDNFKKSGVTDLRKCEEWNTYQGIINNLVAEKRSIIMNTSIQY